MLEITQTCLDSITQDYEVVVQYGSSAGYQEINNIKVAQAFFDRDEAMEHFRNADIVFSHCGIGSIYNSLQLNRPTVLIPRLKKYAEFSDDHQLQIANEVKRNELVFMIEDINENLSVKFQQFLKFGLKVKKYSRDIINYELGRTINDLF